MKELQKKILLKVTGQVVVEVQFLKKIWSKTYGFAQIVTNITELNQAKDLIFYLVKIIMKYLKLQFQKMIH